MTFELPLAEERVKLHQVTALHLFVAFIIVVTGAVVLAAYYSVSRMPLDKAMQFRSMLYYGQALGIGLLVLGVCLLITAVFKRKSIAASPAGNMVLRMFELILLVALLVMAVRNGLTVPAVMYGILAAAVTFAIYWEKKTDQPLTIHVDQAGVKLPTLRRRFIGWKDIDYVLLRFDTLTLNLHDNSMMQWNVGQIEFEKELFDVYCIRQIEKAKEQRPKNDW